VALWSTLVSDVVAGQPVPVYNSIEQNVNNYKPFTEFCSQSYSGDNPNQSLVHQHNSVCGGSAMLTFHILQPPVATTQIAIFDDTDNTFFVHGKYIMQSTSLIQLSTHQLTRAYSFPWIIGEMSPNSVISADKFVCKHANNLNSYKIMRNTVNITFAPGSTFAGALAKAQDEFTKSQIAQGLRVGPIVLTSKDVIGCYWNPIFNELIATVNPVVRKGVGMIGESVCGKYGPHCSQAGTLLYDWISSSLMTETNDIKSVGAASKTGKKGKIAKLISGAFTAAKIVAPVVVAAMM